MIKEHLIVISFFLCMCVSALCGCPIDKKYDPENEEPVKNIVIYNECKYDIIYSTIDDGGTEKYALLRPGPPIYFDSVAKLTIKNGENHYYAYEKKDKSDYLPGIILGDGFKLQVSTKTHGQKVYTAQQLIGGRGEFDDGFLFLNYSFGTRSANLQISFCKQ